MDIVVVAAYLAARAQDLLHAYESQTAFQTFMEETLTFALSHSTEITSAAAVLALPIYIYMMRKDEKYRRLFTVPDPDSGKTPAWTYLYAVLLGVTAGVALNNILILSNISSISVSYQTTSAGLYASPVIIEVIGLGVIVPVLEECLYRGVIFRRIRDMVDARKAILFSALILPLCMEILYSFCMRLYSDCFCHMPMRLTKVSKHRFCCTVQQILAQCF